MANVGFWHSVAYWQHSRRMTHATILRNALIANKRIEAHAFE